MNDLFDDFEYENQTITLDLEDGGMVECDILAIFEAGEYEYLALYPKKVEEDGEVLIYRFSEDEEGAPVLDNIETDEEFAIVEEAFDKLQDEW